jgi:DUF4097 and DUF4098 domain-containing protein YvlB
MASSTQIPPVRPVPPPVRPPRQPRSFAGPIVLIVIGIFFLLGNMGWIAWHHLGYWFAHYWPLLLIIWGVIKLIEYQNANRAGIHPRGIGAGGVILIIFVVIMGLTATEAYRVNWQELRDEMHIQGDVPWWGHSYDYTDEVQQAFPAGDSLHVTNERGAINLTAANDNNIHITVHKRVNADRQEEADNWNKSTQPQVSLSGAVMTVNANTKGAGEHWVSSDLDIAVPRKASIVASTRHGDISVMGRDGNGEITSQDGDVSVTDLNGSLTLNLDNSSARVAQIASDVTVNGRGKDISLEDVKGVVRLDGDFMESVKLTRIAKTVSFKSTRTDMDFTKLDGYLNLDSGDLEASSLTGPLRLRTRSKDIMLNGITSDVHLDNENGAVEIHLNKLGNLEVTNAKGDIRIFLPEKSAFQVDAQARDGEIQSDFSELKIDNGDNRSTATGSVNGGGPRMVLNLDHGSIEIRKGVAIPPPPPAPKGPRAPTPPQVPGESEN